MGNTRELIFYGLNLHHLTSAAYSVVWHCSTKGCTRMEGKGVMEGEEHKCENWQQYEMLILFSGNRKGRILQLKNMSHRIFLQKKLN